MHSERREGFIAWRKEQGESSRAMNALSRQIEGQQCFCYTGLMVEYWRQQVAPDLSWTTFEAVQAKLTRSECVFEDDCHTPAPDALYLRLSGDPRGSVIGTMPSWTVNDWYGLPMAIIDLEGSKLPDVCDRIRLLSVHGTENSIHLPIMSVLANLNDISEPLVPFAALDELLRLF